MNGDKLKLDEIDLRILAILQDDGRITNAKLASEVGLSAPPILERVKKLERAGIIKGYRAILNAEALGCHFLVFVAVTVDVRQLSRIEAFEEMLVQSREVVECHHIAGNIDFLLKVRVKDQQHYKKFVAEHLAKIEGISSLVSWVALHTSKETRGLPIPAQVNGS